MTFRRKWCVTAFALSSLACSGFYLGPDKMPQVDPLTTCEAWIYEPDPYDSDGIFTRSPKIVKAQITWVAVEGTGPDRTMKCWLDDGRVVEFTVQSRTR